jgi:hypothetical protein
MARIEEVTVTMIDDLDGSQAPETIAFALEGVNYEIDLSKRNVNGLRRVLKPYVEGGRKVRRASGNRTPKGARRSSSSGAENYDLAEVRAWAKSHRIKVAARGRIASEVVERWRQSNGK